MAELPLLLTFANDTLKQVDAFLGGIRQYPNQINRAIRSLESSLSDVKAIGDLTGDPVVPVASSDLLEEQCGACRKALERLQCQSEKTRLLIHDDNQLLRHEVSNAPQGEIGAPSHEQKTTLLAHDENQSLRHDATDAPQGEDGLINYEQELTSLASVCEECSAQLNRSLEILQKQKDLQLLHDWLRSLSSFTTSYPTTVRITAESATKDTGAWFFNDQRFVSWKQGSSPSNTLLIRGPPGVGKTTLACRLIESLSRNERLESESERVAYLLCSYTDAAEGLYQRLMLTLLSQILECVGGSTDLIEKLKRYKITESVPSANDCEKFITGLVSKSSHPIFLVVDALDECNNDKPTYVQDEVVAFLKRVATQKNVRLASTSRTALVLSDSSVIINMQVPREDLRAYLQSKGRELDSLVENDEDFREQVFSEIIERSQNIFRLSNLLLTWLLTSAETKAEAKQALLVMPSGVAAYETLYRETVSRIKLLGRERAAAAQAAILITLRATRPLHVDEFEHVCATQVDEEFDLNNIVEAAALVSYCAGLITVEESSRTVKFSHFTVQEFLLAEGKKYYADDNLNLFRRCRQYIGGASHSRDTESGDQFCAFRFLRYAASEIVKHALNAMPARAPTGSAQLSARLFDGFLNDAPARTTAFLALQGDHGLYSAKAAQSLSPMHVALRYGSGAAVPAPEQALVHASSIDAFGLYPLTWMFRADTVPIRSGNIWPALISAAGPLSESLYASFKTPREAASLLFLLSALRFHDAYPSALPANLPYAPLNQGRNFMAWTVDRRFHAFVQGQNPAARNPLLLDKPSDWEGLDSRARSGPRLDGFSRMVLKLRDARDADLRRDEGKELGEGERLGEGEKLDEWEKLEAEDE